MPRSYPFHPRHGRKSGWASWHFGWLMPPTFVLIEWFTVRFVTRYHIISICAVAKNLTATSGRERKQLETHDPHETLQFHEQRFSTFFFSYTRIKLQYAAPIPQSIYYLDLNLGAFNHTRAVEWSVVKAKKSIHLHQGQCIGAQHWAALPKFYVLRQITFISVDTFYQWDLSSVSLSISRSEPPQPPKPQQPPSPAPAPVRRHSRSFSNGVRHSTQPTVRDFYSFTAKHL